MTNNDLQNFSKELHPTLTLESQSNLFKIKEQNNESAIKELRFTFKNKQDIAIIQQKSGNCPATTNILKNKTNLKSCDFIVLIHKEGRVKIYFCEIKSSLTDKTKKEAKLQIESSKIFLDYVQKNYILYHPSEGRYFSIDIENSKSILIYPKFSIPQKKPTYGDTLNFVPVEVHDGISKINDGYDFFESL